MTELFREYHRTHDWIKFIFDTNELSRKAWLKLGQIQAMCEYISAVPLSPSVAQQMHTVFLAKGIHATTAIEGNTLTEEEVLQLLNNELQLPPSKDYLATEVNNIANAMNEIAKNMVERQAPTELNPEDIKNYHRMILADLELREEVIPGEYRSHDVRVLSYKGAPVDDLTLLMQRMCNWLNGWPSPQELEVALGVLKAILAHVYIAWIHPFADGNGRTARLIELQILLGVGLPMPTTHLLSNHYNETRAEYYRYLDISSKHDDGIYQFIEYALQGFIDQLAKQIEYVKSHQLSVHWEKFIYDSFRNKDSKADTRRRRLVLDLSSKREVVTLPDTRYVSPRIAEAYADKTDKTVQRDINILIKMGLVHKTAKGIRASKNRMLAFLPQKREVHP